MSDMLTAASYQWANRPDDERFWSVEDLATMVQERRDRSEEKLRAFKGLAFGSTPGHGSLGSPALHLINSENSAEATLTNFAFNQICRELGAPAAYLSGLSGDLAARNLNYALTRMVPEGRDKTRNFLFLHNKEGERPTLRSFASEIYGRIWDSQAVNWLMNLRRDGWRTPPARPAPGVHSPRVRTATEADVIGIPGAGGVSIRIGDLIAPAGVYASDRDMFVFLVDENHPVEAGGETLFRGFFLVNSEVAGQACFSLNLFFFRGVCGNHIVWNPREFTSLRTRHVGNALDRARLMMPRILGYLDSRSDRDREIITESMGRMLGQDREETVNEARKVTLLPAHVASMAYDNAEQEGLNPRSAWGMVQGITQIARDLPYTDRRHAMETAASKLLGF